MKIITIEAGPILTNTYIVFDEHSKKAVIIDAPLDSIEVLRQEIEKQNLIIDGILLTHTHWDHSGDTADLQSLYKAKVYLHKDDEYRLLKPNHYSIFQLPVKIKEASGDVYVTEGNIINFGKCSLQVLNTPGHTEGGICFYSSIDKIVFCGDTVFRDSIGRVDLPGGSFDVLANSIKDKLLVLDDETELLPGHGPKTTVGYERKYNPFFREMGIV